MDDLSDEGAKGGNDIDHDQNIGWIQWYCSLDGHEYMIEVEESFIRDQFNLYGLQQSMEKDKFKQCLKMILSPQAPGEEDLADE